MPKFDTENGFIHYEVLNGSLRSAAATITLLHNFMSTGPTAWGRIATKLASSYRVLLIDSPGHGRSIGYPDAYDHLEMARQIGQLMHTEGAEKGHLAGCSSGGMIAQHIVHQAFASPASLTLVSTTYSNNPATTGNLRKVTPEEFQMGDKPTCVIHGEEDEFFPLYIPQSMADAIPNAQLHIVPAQTHALIFRKSTRVFDIMNEFLDQTL